MENQPAKALHVSDFIAIMNDTLAVGVGQVYIEGEIAHYTVQRGKFVFFDLKDEGGSLQCFMMLFWQHTRLEDGMNVRVAARPQLTDKGKFSLTVDAVQPLGAGSVQRQFELLRAELQAEGLFDPSRKRPLPVWPKRIAVITSAQAAGYHDFMSIIRQQGVAVAITVHDVAVQGTHAAEEMVHALQRVNAEASPAEAVILLRGGGNRDDLAAFDDERLVRAIAASRVPVATAIGHEVDTTLADEAADRRFATPSHAAAHIVPQRSALQQQVVWMQQSIASDYSALLDASSQAAERWQQSIATQLRGSIVAAQQRTAALDRVVRSYNPAAVLARGYAIVRGTMEPGGKLVIETDTAQITAKVETYEQK